MTDAGLTFRNLTLGYRGVPAVTGIDGVVERGSLTAVVGANGSGKSTLLKGAAGILKPMSGSLMRAPGTEIAYLPQRSELDATFPASVFDLVSLGHWPRRGLLGRSGAGDRDRLDGALEAVGLSGFGHRSLDELSGGQMQRALFARTMLQDAGLILLDEPFNAVDAATVADLLAIVRRWNAEGRTVIAVLHDLEIVRAHFPRALRLAGWVIAWGSTQDVLATIAAGSPAAAGAAARDHGSPPGAGTAGEGGGIARNGRAA